MKIKIKKLSNDSILPTYANYDDAGMDFYSLEKIEIKPNQRIQVQTGIAMEIPIGHVGLIWDKSGISHNHGLKTLGGVIDSGYRGEIKIGVINLSDKVYVLEKGHKIAQMIIQEKITPELVEVDDLADSQRGESGFGASGK